MKRYIFIYLLATGLANIASVGNATAQVETQKKVNKEQLELNEHRDKLDKRKARLDNKERHMRKMQKRLNKEQKDIDKKQPVNEPAKASNTYGE